MSRSSFAFISLILFLVGLVLIFGSVGWGSGTANAYLRSLGGSMDTGQFTVILQGYINQFRWAGSILSIIGGFGFVKTIQLK